MRQFDPWPVFFKREGRRNWPFLVGFAITGSIITKISLGLTEEQAKNSAFVQRHNKRMCLVCGMGVHFASGCNCIELQCTNVMAIGSHHRKPVQTTIDWSSTALKYTFKIQMSDLMFHKMTSP
ncbi:hypothetical protein GIB67_017419 [Kingdonia uniflora]|uniref:Uncharacterized protein n=1 Tax=Kingdonia uniflora TaxID=39325 RepID=A0A7J7M4A3_9MAGN|nr:hypothetical protein GIB67_017419 [Kingdonia uniflora]